MTELRCMQTKYFLVDAILIQPNDKEDFQSEIILTCKVLLMYCMIYYY